MRLIEGDAERRECGDFDIDSDVCCLREGVIDVIRERMRVGDGSGSWASFWADGEDIYIDVVRIVRIDPAIEGARTPLPGVPDVDNDGSKRGKFCTGADVRLLCPDSDGIELERRFALTDGTGTGVPLEGVAGGAGILKLVRTVVLPLARVVALMDAPLTRERLNGRYVTSAPEYLRGFVKHVRDVMGSDPFWDVTAKRKDPR